jgi:sporulation protein YlmC with PRC-barrel domain
MRRDLIAAASALALMAGAAQAQTTGAQGAPGAQSPQTMQNSPAADRTGGATQGQPTGAGQGGGMQAQGGTAGQGPTTAGGMTMLPEDRLDDLVGKTLVTENGEEIGEIEDVILDPQTQKARQIVVSSGGFLGIGEKRVAIDASRVLMQGDGDEFQVSGMSREDVEGMPEFEMDEGMVSLSKREDQGGGSGEAARPAIGPTGQGASNRGPTSSTGQ